MKKNEKSYYEISLFSSPIVFPFNFFSNHSWFVIAKDGVFSRWEVRFTKNRKKGRPGKFLHLTHSSLDSGCAIAPYLFTKKTWPGKLLKKVSGSTDSLACRMYEFINNESWNYKYRNRYFNLGPNCNTYIQWILDNFPEFDYQLSRIFVGSKYSNKI